MTGTGISWIVNEDPVWALLTIIFLYFAIGSRRVYGFTWLRSVGAGILLTWLLIVVLTNGVKSLVFAIVMATL